MKWLALALLAFSAAAHADADDWRGPCGGLGGGGGTAHSTWVTDATFGTLDEQVDQKARGGLIGGQFGWRGSARGAVRGRLPPARDRGQGGKGGGAEPA